MKPCITLLTGLLLLPAASSAFAVRPFVTDDARVIDVGQVEMESWLETTRAGGLWEPAPGLNAIVGTTFTEWLEVLAGTGIGRNQGGSRTSANPVLIGKVLLQQATADGRPGHAFSIQHTFDEGSGSMYDAGRVSSLVGMTTFRLRNDSLYLHLNYGIRSDRTPQLGRHDRVYWGIGAEAHTPIPKLDFVIEAFAGDPFVPDAPKYAMQTGLRYLRSDYLQFDFTMGLDPKRDAFGRTGGGAEFTAQLGMRMVFDFLTPGGRRGNPEGARGLFR